MATLCLPCERMGSSEAALNQLCSVECDSSHGSVNDIRRTAADGCPLCLMVTNPANSSDPKEFEDVLEGHELLYRNVMFAGARDSQGQLTEIVVWVDGERLLWDGTYRRSRDNPLLQRQEELDFFPDSTLISSLMFA
jgi:hypothetical protein